MQRVVARVSALIAASPPPGLFTRTAPSPPPSRRGTRRSRADRACGRRRGGPRSGAGLDLGERGRHRRAASPSCDGLPSRGPVATGARRGAGGDVARPDLDAQRDAAELPVVELEARRHALAVVHLHAHARAAEGGGHAIHRRPHRRGLGRAPRDRHQDDLVRGQARRQDQALVVAVGHRDRADHARGQAPARGPAVLELVDPVEVADLEGAREVLPEVVRGAGLQRPPVAHHGLDGVGADAPAKRSLALAPLDRRSAASVSAKSRRSRAAGASRPRPPRRWHGRCGPLATRTRWCGGRASCGAPSGRRCSRD
jgi:hypothetical protein